MNQLRRIATGGVLATSLIAGTSIESSAPPISPEISQPTRQIRPAHPYEGVNPPVDAVILEDPDARKYLSEDQIQTMIEDADAGMRYSTRGVHGLGEVAFRTVTLQPESTVELGGRPYACYTEKQIERVHADTSGRKKLLGRQLARMIFVNSHVVCNADGVAAWAVLSGDDNPYRVYDLPVMNNGASIIGHEEGHELGLPHQRALDCRRGTKEKMTNAYSFDTIQNLIGEGCQLVTYKDGVNAGKVNEYASFESVMGNSDIWSPTRSYRPMYSVPEMAYLDHDIIVEDIPAASGKYYVSYEAGKTLALRMSLPEKHALRTAVPGTSHIMFAPSIHGTHLVKGVPNSLVNPENTVKIVPFAVSDDSKLSAALDIGLFNDITSVAAYNRGGNDPFPSFMNEPVSNWDRYLTVPMVYADSDLGIAVSGGVDEGGVFIEITSLNDPATKAKFDYTKKVTTDRNDFLIEAQKEDSK